MTYNILLVVTGSIAVCKVPDLISTLQASDCTVVCVMTASAEEFMTAEELEEKTHTKVYTQLFDNEDPDNMDHIRLSREADIILVVPATANMLAKMVHGYADDLASTLLLAADKPIAVAPAMNVKMWDNPANQRNVTTLSSDGVIFLGPDSGALACGEFGKGRMIPPEAIVQETLSYLHYITNPPLQGKRALVTSGPTFEPIDPVRYIGNYSTGKQGHAIAEALAKAGADVTLITGPVSLTDPANVHTQHVTTAQEMLESSLNSLPADIAVCAAAVSDWRPDNYLHNKMKKDELENNTLSISLEQNPDILASISQHADLRPSLVIGFAAETDNVISYAQNKLEKKQCDWILANDVSNPESTFGSDTNHVYFINSDTNEDWSVLSKKEVSEKLVEAIVDYFS